MSRSRSTSQDAEKPQRKDLLSRISLSNIKSPLSAYFALYRPLKTWHDKFILFSGIILALAAGAPLPIIGVIFSKIINTFPPSADEIKTRIVELIAVAIAYFAVTWGWAVCWGITGERVSRGLREDMVDRALGLDQTYYETECPDITSRLTADAQVVQSGTSEKVGLFLQSVSYFIVAFAVGFWLNAKLTGILFAGVIPSMACVVYIGTMYISRYSTQATECTALASAVAEGAIRAVQVVQAFGAAETLNVEHTKHLNEAVEKGVKKALAGAMLLGGIFFVAFAANALAFWEGSRLAEGTSSGAGTIYAIVFLVLDASFVVGQFGPFIQSFALAATAGGRILDLIDYPPQPIDVYSEKGIRVNKTTFHSDISFEGVSFAYPARPTESVLKKVSFNLKSGKTIGVVGSSGSGKSTIAGLLLRLYDAKSGRVLLGDNEISQFNLASLRTQVALVDQDPAVFSGTVLSNIRQGIKSLGPLSEEETRERCIAAAKDADAWSFIQNLPDGIDNRLGEPDGTKLSGGQKQRLCLARALVDDPSILILDEATSALDTISEAAILKSLSESRHKSSRTTIMIAHRLATVKDADEIIVMGHGQVIEQGSHSDLVTKENGAYRSLLEAQKLTHVADDTNQAKNIIEAEMDGREGHVSKVLDPSSASNFAIEVSKPSKEQAALHHIIGRCLSLTKDKWLLTILALLASTVTGCLIIGESLIFGNLVGILNGSTVDYSRVNFFCLMFFILAIIALAAYILAGTCFGIVSEHLIFRTRDLSLRTILKQDAEWFLLPNHSTTALTAVLSMDSSHLAGLSGVILGTVFTGLASVIGGAILAHIVAWKIAIVLFSTSPIVICAGFFRLSVIAKVEERNQKSYTQAAALATEACSAIRTVAALGAEKDIASRFRYAVRSQEKKNLAPTIFGNLLLAVALAITYFVYALAYYWGSKLVREHAYTSLDFFIVLPAILFSAQASGQMFSLAPEVGRARAAAARVFALHDERPTIDNSKIMDGEGKIINITSGSNTSSSSTLVLSSRASASTPTANSLWKSQILTPAGTPGASSEQISEMNLLPPSTSTSTPTGNIEFRNVSLTYASRPDKPVLKNLSFIIPAGQAVAFVGTSGAGKSSAINLIERFYDPTEGTILIDGIDIKSMPVDDHRARLSLVAQEPGLFAGTVAFNVGLGSTARGESEEEKQDRIERACKACGIHDFVFGLPDGYKTQCGLNGSQLSGGQKQRLAIARACVRDPEVLLLDEATSALDSHSEQQVQAAISSASSKRTTIMIAHRLTTVQTADRIMVFDAGKIVGDGTHQELVNQGGVYSQMVGMQMLG